MLNRSKEALTILGDCFARLSFVTNLKLIQKERRRIIEDALDLIWLGVSIMALSEGRIKQTHLLSPVPLQYYTRGHFTPPLIEKYSGDLG